MAVFTRYFCIHLNGLIRAVCFFEINCFIGTVLVVKIK